MSLLLAGALAALSPEIVVEDGLEPKAAIEAEALQQWSALEARFRAARKENRPGALSPAAPSGVPGPAGWKENRPGARSPAAAPEVPSLSGRKENRPGARWPAAPSEVPSLSGRKENPPGALSPAAPSEVPSLSGRKENPPDSVSRNGGAIRIRREITLAPAVAAKSAPFRISLRQNAPGVIDEPLRLALRHELAHQFLFTRCPEASEDPLFHEAFAISTSGEISAWTEGEYRSLPRSKAALEQAKSLETKEARAALARLLIDGPASSSGLAIALERRLARCGSGARWVDPLSTDELAGASYGATRSADALIVISRHSGETLFAEGSSRTPMPFGSTLKPFLVAGARRAPPHLPPDPLRAEWACGSDLPPLVDEQTALARSCNGYFLDWAKQDPEIAGLGAYGPLLVALGLLRPPADASEAIGLRPVLQLSPWALAQAYRVLAEARPDLVATLEQTLTEGTLRGTHPSSEKLRGVAFKTGTVRDAESRPALGWIVAIDDDLVVVMSRRGRAPRTFFAELGGVLQKYRGLRSTRAATVQVFGLVLPESIEVACEGISVIAAHAGPVLEPRAASPLLSLVERGPALCLGAPWRVKLETKVKADREYRGVFSYSPAPAQAAEPRAPSDRARRARAGSDFLFRTTLLAYTFGVVDAEDAALAGEARIALAQVVAHNAAVAERHHGRPICDTTHCQVFLGTRRAKADDLAILDRPKEPDPLEDKGWLTFSKGGDEPWEEQRSAAQVESLLGRGLTSIVAGAGRVRWVRAVEEGGSIFEEPNDAGCERLRSPLKLPSCPTMVARIGGAYVFRGRGAGHGEGLDLERAKRSTKTAVEILRSAYGLDRVSGR